MSAHAISEPSRPDEVITPVDLPPGLPSGVRGWVSRVAGLTGPDEVLWCDGSPAETDRLYATLVALDPVRVSADDLPEVLVTPCPGPQQAQESAHARSGMSGLPAPERVRPRTEAQRRTLLRLFAGCMRGRVMYAVPYATREDAVPREDAAARSREDDSRRDAEVVTRLGIELTDSPWVVLNLGFAARVGVPALRRIRAGHRWAASVHSVGYPLLDESGNRRPDVPWPCNPEKWIATFPDTGDVWSFGTGFGAAHLADCTSA